MSHRDDRVLLIRVLPHQSKTGATKQFNNSVLVSYISLRHCSRLYPAQNVTSLSLVLLQTNMHFI